MQRMALIAASALALAGCGRAGVGAPTSGAGRAAVQPPARKAGLWEQSMTRDGAALAIVGRVRVCVDAASEARLSLFGGRMGRSACPRRAVVRRPGGGYAFASTCDMGEAGVTTTSGTLSGDLAARYRIHAHSDTAGSSVPAMNGGHVTDIDATWLGPCPAGMNPGDMILANGMKINAGKLAGLAQAVGGGG
ncbi:MAG: DUF3617 domain-containing protein [Caulobacteraceae bacterium]